MTQRRQVFILCPGGMISGGPEALHQLAGALSAHGVAAAMVYYPPRAGPYAVPEPYRRYGVTVCRGVEDDAASVIVVPEVATALSWRFPHAMKAIWWLSVNNYFKWQHRNPGPSVLDPHPDFVHLCQSRYAQEFLAARRASPLLMLTDYLPEGEFAPGPPTGRLPIVAYNPKRASEATDRLIARGGCAWVPLEGLDKASLAELLRQARIYADFGPHPGRDRIPREAAMCGAIVLTGRRGAAAFAADVPIPERFRPDEAAADFEAGAAALIDELLRSDTAFMESFEQQAPYRDWIGGNRDVFMNEVDSFIAAMDLEHDANRSTSRTAPAEG